MAECKAYRRELDEAADGGVLSTGARAHAALCRTCGQELRVRESLRALVGSLGKVEAPADFEFRLRARMAAAKGGGVRSVGTRWLYGFAPVAVAACFVIVSATLYFRQAARTNTAVAPTVAVVPARNDEPVQVPPRDVPSRLVESTVAGGRVVKSIQGGAVSLKAQKVVRRVSARDLPAREVASKSESRADVMQKTAEFSNNGAQVIHLKASAESLRVILRDERGAERVVPMRSVSFGSQDFLARGAAAKPSVAVEVGGVW